MNDSFQAVIFDMDGTIIEPLIDFAAIRAELGIPAGSGLLETIRDMPPETRFRAHRTLLDHELRASSRAMLMPHAAESIAAIRRAGLKTALLTRNARQAMQTVIGRFGLSFDLAWSRDDGPIKPDPDGVIKACQALSVRADRTMCVGDYHYDVVAANAAGAVSVLLAGPVRPAWAAEARHVIQSLAELPPLLGI